MLNEVFNASYTDAEFQLKKKSQYMLLSTLQWRHNERDGVSNHRADSLVAQPFVQTQIKENTEAPRHWPLWGESPGDRWIPLSKGQ